MDIFLGRVLLYYLLFINACAFLLFGLDKYRARRRKWRVSEAELLAAAAVGGALGAFLGILVFRHKTRYLKFTIGVPLLLLCWVLLLLYGDQLLFP